MNVWLLWCSQFITCCRKQNAQYFGCSSKSKALSFSFLCMCLCTFVHVLFTKWLLKQIKKRLRKKKTAVWFPVYCSAASVFHRVKRCGGGPVTTRGLEGLTGYGCCRCRSSMEKVDLFVMVWRFWDLMCIYNNLKFAFLLVSVYIFFENFNQVNQMQRAIHRLAVIYILELQNCKVHVTHIHTYPFPVNNWVLCIGFVSCSLI